jgi:hypothetical protein
MPKSPDAFEVDTTEWIRVGGTHAGAYYRAAEDVLVAVPKRGFVQTPQAALASLAELDRLAHEVGRRQAVIVLVDRVAAQDAPSRRVWSTPRPNETRCAQGLICSSMLARAIGSFFIGLNRGTIPTRMFEFIEDGLQWAREIVRERGGAI